MLIPRHAKKKSKLKQDNGANHGDLCCKFYVIKKHRLLKKKKKSLNFPNPNLHRSV